ncbi:MAG TPA: ABC transporter permease [Candidatus Fournierella merdigallinarum]|nr:ABC transporter permease [Candidatus Fournierella merdigallinarum]
MKTTKKRNSRFYDIMRRLARNKLAMVGLFIIVALVLIAIFADFIAPYGYAEQNWSDAFQAPNADHWFGTDHLGRDLFSRVVYGTRYSLRMGVVTVAIAASLGTIVGAFAGFYGGSFDNIVMRVLDIFQSIPILVFAIILAAALEPGLNNAIVAMGVSTMPIYARLIRASIMQERGSEYVEAATAINAGDMRILFRHILPNAISPMIVHVTMNIGSAILIASTLSFLGLGAQEPTPEWGAILSGARSYMRDYGYMLIFPGIMIMLSVLSFNLLGDGLRDALDPRLKGN